MTLMVVHTGGPGDVTTVAHGVLKQMIRLACLYLQENALDQAAFVKSGSFQTLFTFLSDPDLRFTLLFLVSSLAVLNGPLKMSCPVHDHRLGLWRRSPRSEGRFDDHQVSQAEHSDGRDFPQC